jgi:urease accessory protein UreE
MSAFHRNYEWKTCQCGEEFQSTSAKLCPRCQAKVQENKRRERRIIRKQTYQGVTAEIDSPVTLKNGDVIKVKYTYGEC